MGNIAVFLDRDGTINIDKNYLYKREDFEYLPGSVAGLKLLTEYGYCLIVITNQSGIGRGFYSEEDFLKIDRWMKNDLLERGVNISGTYYCPHIEDTKIKRYRKVCQCRKPNLGLFWKASIDFHIDIDRSFAIGDRLRDLSICNVSQCRGYLIGKTESPEIIKDIKNGGLYHVIWKPNIYECAKSIIEDNDIL